MIKVNNSILANVSVIYFLVWAPLIALSRLDLFFFSIRGDIFIELYVSFFIISFFLIYFIFYSLYKYVPNHRSIDIMELNALKSFTIKLFRIWFIGFVLNTILSGGLPVLWVLYGDFRTYSNYGMPTFSGLLNMIRMFIIISLVICNTNKVPLPKYIALILVFSLFAELNRAAILYGLLVAMCAFLMFNKMKFRNLLKIFSVFVFFLIVFSFIAEFRELGRGGYKSPADNFNADVAWLSSLMYVVIYYLSPLNNLYYQYSLGFDPSFTPYFTLQSLLPTVIRDIVFQNDTKYSVNFANEAFNTSPYLANIISDFGMGGALVIVIFIQFLSCYIYIRAKRNSLSHCMYHCMIWGATALSCFTNLYFTLILVLFPILVLIFSRYKRRYIKYHVDSGESAN